MYETFEGFCNHTFIIYKVEMETAVPREIASKMHSFPAAKWGVSSSDVTVVCICRDCVVIPLPRGLIPPHEPLLGFLCRAGSWQPY